MKDTIEKVVKDLGAISINNLISTEESSNFDLYPEDYDPVTGLFLCQESERHFINQKGGTYAKKKSRNNHGKPGNR